MVVGDDGTTVGTTPPNAAAYLTTDHGVVLPLLQDRLSTAR